ncbi:MAG: Hsp70 family protein [Planctomycetota bacterium]|nr:Hsp70 family protein [Planctomycetota bacterium]
MAIIGIDLGTTNSLVSVLRGAEPETLANEMGEHLTPSAVAVAQDGALLVGRPAWDRLIQSPASGRAFFKRDMGTQAVYPFGGKRWTPTECSAMVLNEMKRIAQLHLGRETTRAVVTVPAYFRESQRAATAEAATLAGLSVERIINEPTAAALAYGYREPDKETRLLVFDLGGGTFDVTVLEVFSGVIEVRASGGESRLGGEDYTDALLDRLLAQCNLRPDHPGRAQMRPLVESLKRRLSAREQTAITLEGHELLVSRKDLAAAGAELTGRLRPIVMRCLRDAGLEPEKLDEILLVGGASRMHVITEFIAGELKRPGSMKLDPDRVVALGAAVQAALCGESAAVKDLVLTDVCAHTLGISVAKQFSPGQIVPGYYEPLIERNTTVPVSRAKLFSAFSPQQDSILIEIYQGEARMAKENHLLGKLRVTGLKRAPGEEDPGSVEIRFSYDMSGLLEVDATVEHTRKTFHMMIEERPGALTKKQIEAIRQRMAPLKVSPRDRVHNRARLERAARMYAALKGEERQELTMLLDRFEEALGSQDESAWDATGRQLDIFLSLHALEEGEWQPPAEGKAPGA